MLHRVLENRNKIKFSLVKFRMIDNQTSLERCNDSSHVKENWPSN
jgi:hypothetical protein